MDEASDKFLKLHHTRREPMDSEMKATDCFYHLPKDMLERLMPFYFDMVCRAIWPQATSFKLRLHGSATVEAVTPASEGSEVGAHGEHAREMASELTCENSPSRYGDSESSGAPTSSTQPRESNPTETRTAVDGDVPYAACGGCHVEAGKRQRACAAGCGGACAAVSNRTELQQEQGRGNGVLPNPSEVCAHHSRTNRKRACVGGLQLGCSTAALTAPSPPLATRRATYFHGRNCKQFAL